jgi:hypothetical protein
MPTVSKLDTTEAKPWMFSKPYWRHTQQPVDAIYAVRFSSQAPTEAYNIQPGAHHYSPFDLPCCTSSVNTLQIGATSGDKNCQILQHVCLNTSLRDLALEQPARHTYTAAVSW